MERQIDVRKIRLERMHMYSELCGNPHTCAPSFHIAGSKGKGSVTQMIASILNAWGKKTALYASPHLNDFRERLNLGGSFFPEDVYIQGGNELKALLDALPAKKGEEATFFELMTMWFFLCSRIAHCDIMAVETGLGGRLDTTNILDPLVSVINIIELEHTDLLGNTLGAIAAEKAGIIKAGRPLVLSEQKDEALKVFKKHAKEKKVKLYYFPLNAEAKDIVVSPKGTFFKLKIGDRNFNELFIPVPGEVQAKNAGLALLSLLIAYPDIPEEAIRKGLANFYLPGRFERICEKPEVIIDGAHTANSIEMCLKTFTGIYGSEGILLFGCAEGKDLAKMAELLAPSFSTIIITTPGSFKKSNPEEIYKIFSARIKEEGLKTELLFIPGTKEAIEKARLLALKVKQALLGTGSFYLAGEIKSSLGME